MRKLIIITLFSCMFVVRAQEKYTSKFAFIDLDKVLENERLLRSYYRCLLDDVGCDPQGDELRRILPDAIRTACARCTEEQKAGARKVVSYLVKEKSEWWKNLVGKYDPDETYRRKFRDQLKAEGFDF